MFSKKEFQVRGRVAAGRGAKSGLSKRARDILERTALGLVSPAKWLAIAPDMDDEAQAVVDAVVAMNRPTATTKRRLKRKRTRYTRIGSPTAYDTRMPRHLTGY